MILCGWCGAATTAGSCLSCGRDAALPWEQRGTEPPSADPAVDDIRRRLHDAASHVGRGATIDQLAEHLDVSPRTVRRWREKAR